MVSVLLGRDMATKAKGLKTLIGKKVKVKDRYGADGYDGPFTVLSVDLPFIELEYEEAVFWWNVNTIEGLQEYKEEVIEAN